MPPVPPPREVSSRLDVVVPERTSFVLGVAVADGVPVANESLRVVLDGADVPVRELRDVHGTRLHVFSTGAGLLTVDYSASVVGRAEPPAVDELELIVYGRPSRYVQSDSLTDRAREQFGHLRGLDLIAAVESWVHDRLTYTSGLGALRGGAVETLDAGRGVCRDYAHVVLGFLRALDVPARFVAVYAPELDPPDFHAVVEAFVEGRWLVVDATRLAPRRGFVRIATGRDAADTAFLTTTLADIELRTLEVRATGAGIARDDPAEPVVLG